MLQRSLQNTLIHAAAASFLLAAGVSFEARADESVAAAPATTPAADAPVQPADAAAPAKAPTPAPAPAPVTTSSSAAISGMGEAAMPAHPWSGTRLYYGPGMSAYTLNAGGLPHYNPTVYHHLDLWGEWHFNKLLMARVLGGLSQELTLSDDTTYKNEVVLSDFSVDSGIEGYSLPWWGLKGSLTGRIVLPFSKASLAATRLFSLGAGAGVSKRFDVGGGLIVGYAARYSLRFNRSTSGEPNLNPLMACRAQTSDVCDSLVQTGVRNAWSDVFHGGRVVWTPNEKVYAVAFFYLTDQFLYRPAPVTGDAASSTALAAQGEGTSWRAQNRFGGFVGWDFTKGYGVSFGYDTTSPQLDPGSGYYNPFFNQFTQLSLDLSVDIDEALSRLL